jgi:3'-phosphoadenosine 5'-phosphosulfate sulfotransferase (PAPS reductase)/FAD synthetase
MEAKKKQTNITKYTTVRKHKRKGHKRVKDGKVEYVKPATISEHKREKPKPQISEEKKKEIKEGKTKKLIKDSKEYLKYGVELADWLKPYADDNSPPNEDIIIPSSTKKNGEPYKRAYDIGLQFYGKYNGDDFDHTDLTNENFDKVILVHDAPHSVALFLEELRKNKGKKAFAMYNKVPFAFPHSLEYVKYFTQKYDFPLLVTDLSGSKSAMEELERNGVMNQGINRWCTRRYKTDPSASVYKRYGLDGIEEVMGLTRHQSSGRAGRNPEKHLSDKSIKSFEIYETYPIYDMKEEEMLEKMKEHNIKVNPTIEKFDFHGCMYCPSRSAEYYLDLKKNHPNLYKQCQKWRKQGSKRKGKEGKKRNKEYYWFNKGKGTKLSKKKMKEHPELIEIM